MKKHLLAFVAALTMLTSCGILSSTGFDAASLATAAGTAMTALTISDEQIAQLSAQSVAYMDSVNKVDRGAYDQRLRKLMGNVKSIDGIPINLKVYRTNEINAFAARFYSKFSKRTRRVQESDEKSDGTELEDEVTRGSSRKLNEESGQNMRVLSALSILNA